MNLLQSLNLYEQSQIDLEVTSACNAVCQFCPRDVMPDTSRFMEIELIEQLADQIRNRQSPPHITLCGIGEPTLHPQIEQIVEILAAAGASLNMTTNGSRMTVDLFENLVDKGIKQFNFSLNALTAETHATVMKMKGFDRITQSVEAVLKVKGDRYPRVVVILSLVVCKQNEHEIEGFVEKWRYSNASQIWLHPVNNRAGLLTNAIKPINLIPYKKKYENDGRVYVDIYQALSTENHICPIVQSLNFISADGELRLCAMDYRRSTAYGNIKDSNLKDMFDSKMNSYIYGETSDLCLGCDFCPTTSRNTRRKTRASSPKVR